MQVYWRNPNGKLGKGEVATKKHIEAIEVAEKALHEEWRNPPHPVLALIPGEKTVFTD